MNTVDLSVHPDKSDDLSPMLLVRRWPEYVSVKVGINGCKADYFMSYEQYEAFRTALIAGLDPANESDCRKGD